MSLSAPKLGTVMLPPLHHFVTKTHYYTLRGTRERSAGLLFFRYGGGQSSSRTQHGYHEVKQ